MAIACFEILKCHYFNICVFLIHGYDSWNQITLLISNRRRRNGEL